MMVMITCSMTVVRQSISRLPPSPCSAENIIAYQISQIRYCKSNIAYQILHIKYHGKASIKFHHIVRSKIVYFKALNKGITLKVTPDIKYQIKDIENYENIKHLSVAFCFQPFQNFHRVFTAHVKNLAEYISILRPQALRVLCSWIICILEHHIKDTGQVQQDKCIQEVKLSNSSDSQNSPMYTPHHSRVNQCSSFQT